MFIMTQRLRIESPKHQIFVEVPHNEPGEERLKLLRQQDPRFKGCRIRSVMQAYPSKVKVHHIYHAGVGVDPGEPLEDINTLHGVYIGVDATSSRVGDSISNLGMALQKEGMMPGDARVGRDYQSLQRSYDDLRRSIEAAKEKPGESS